tara:strand:- start:171 stop:563 length:393 start_codon:yes stop_codon:yes gene_type:complete
MLSKLSSDLNKKVLKITSLKILILNAINNNNYELLATSSVEFIKQTETALQKFMKYEIEHKNSFLYYFEIKEAKSALFKILTCIVSLISKINNVIIETNLTRTNYLRYLEGERRLTHLRENYIYILRKIT